MPIIHVDSGELFWPVPNGTDIDRLFGITYDRDGPFARIEHADPVQEQLLAAVCQHFKLRFIVK